MRMKKRVALISFLLAGTFSAFAQNSELTNAFTLFNIRQTDKAKEAIDKATANEKTKNDPKTWAYRSLIYSSLTLDSTKKASLEANLTTARTAIETGKGLDKKNEYKADFENASRNLAQVYANRGIKMFNAKDFKGAEESFKFVSSQLPTDTTWMTNTAVAATNAQDYKQAADSYTSLLKIKQTPRYYQLLAEAQLNQKDSAAYLKTVQDARVKYPADNALITDELNYYLAKGKASEVIDKLKNAIDKDPKNSSLYVVLGSAYESIKQVDSAEATYKRGLALDPKNFAANFNLGAIYYNKAAVILSKANKLPRTQVAKYNLEVAKFKKTFESATPYLETALAAKPDDVSTLTSLKEIYVRINKNDKAAEMQKRLAALKSK